VELDLFVSNHHRKNYFSLKAMKCFDKIVAYKDLIFNELVWYCTNVLIDIYRWKIYKVTNKSFKKNHLNPNTLSHLYHFDTFVSLSYTFLT